MAVLEAALSFHFLLAVFLFVAKCAAEPFFLADAVRGGVNSLATIRAPPSRFVPPRPSHVQAPILEDLRLVDILVVASIDGKFHALNRTTGEKLWSMTEGPAPDSHSILHNLVRTQHQELKNDGDGQEIYIVEPQSGDIFVLPDNAPRDEPLQRLPFSVPQLVEMSPFSFAEEQRVFVGKKETSLIAMELETGRILRTVNSDSECLWNAFEEHTPLTEDVESALDELEKPHQDPKLQPPKSEVYIGRTDYQISVHAKGKGIIQNLQFSVYGPNNVDRDKQAAWQRTPDNKYLQPFPDGLVFTFDTEREGPQWAGAFDRPIVAVFDVVQTPGRRDPILLLQPRPRLKDVFPRERHAALDAEEERTYVGLVDDSLFAMSHKNYPLVTFASLPPARLTIDSSNTEDGVNVLEAGDPPSDEPCHSLSCFIGARRMSDTSSQSRLSRLLEASDKSGQFRSITTSRLVPSQSQNVVSPVTKEGLHSSLGSGSHSRTNYPAIAAFSIGFVFVWMILRKFMGRLEHDTPSDNAQAHTEELGRPPPVATTPTPMVQVEEPIVTVDAEKQPLLDADANAEEGDGDGEEEDAAAGKKKGPRRRKRGKKNKGVVIAEPVEEPVAGPSSQSDDFVHVERELPKATATIPPPTPLPIPKDVSGPPISTPTVVPSLIVSDKVLGFGSHGTMVFEGSLQGRAVAVKRLLQDFVTLAAREVDLLQESDDHPNVIRYFYKEQKDNFLYIALELCPASLADIIERPDQFMEISAVFDPKKALMQITAGLRHLHLLKIVHRDIKPQNILISKAKNGAHRMLISDFGLCKKLESDQTSFLPTAHGALAAGTVGWRAPEILRGEVKLDVESLESSGGTGDQSSGSLGGVASSNGSSATNPARLTKSVDVFALGCLFFYTITSGDHPFGDRYEREMNILKNAMSLLGLERYGEEGIEAIDLITKMLDPDPKARPDTGSCLLHPFFWTPARRLAFLQDASDRFEIMERDPREPGLVALETGASAVVGQDWHKRLDKVFIENLGKYRKYDGSSVQDLLRALRNKKHHYQDLPDHVKRHLGPLPEGFLGYFTRRFPQLFLHVHSVISNSLLRRESMFKGYFELGESY